MEIISNICFEKELSNTKKINDKTDFLRLWHHSHWFNVLFFDKYKMQCECWYVPKILHTSYYSMVKWFPYFWCQFETIEKTLFEAILSQKMIFFFLLNTFFHFQIIWTISINIFSLDCYLFHCFKEVKKNYVEWYVTKKLIICSKNNKACTVENNIKIWWHGQVIWLKQKFEKRVQLKLIFETSEAV